MSLYEWLTILIGIIALILQVISILRDKYYQEVEQGDVHFTADLLDIMTLLSLEVTVLPFLEDAMSQREPSDIQLEIYKFILKTVKDIGRPPSREQIRERMKFKNKAHVQHHLLMLEKAGWIKLLSDEDYGICLLKRGVLLKGYIAAGQPIESFIEPDQMIDLGPELEDEGNYALVIKGSSMIGDGFLDGDYVVIREQNRCELGEVIVAVHLPEPSNATLKRFTRKDGKVCLEPANGDINPICISIREWHTEWQIQGIVLAVHRRYHWTTRRFVYNKEPY